MKLQSPKIWLRCICAHKPYFLMLCHSLFIYLTTKHVCVHACTYNYVDYPMPVINCLIYSHEFISTLIWRLYTQLCTYIRIHNSSHMYRCWYSIVGEHKTLCVVWNTMPHRHIRMYIFHWGGYLCVYHCHYLIAQTILGSDIFIIPVASWK